MSDKLSVRVDEDTARQLEREEINTSGLVRGLLENYFQTADTVEAGLQKKLSNKQERKRKLEQQKTDIEQDIQSLESEIEQLEHRLKQRREHVPEEVREFAERINDGKFRLENLQPDNPAVDNHAHKAGIPDTEEFIRKVKQQL